MESMLFPMKEIGICQPLLCDRLPGRVSTCAMAPGRGLVSPLASPGPWLKLIGKGRDKETKKSSENPATIIGF